jgi:hypothetical protein
VLTLVPLMLLMRLRWLSLMLMRLRWLSLMEMLLIQWKRNALMIYLRAVVGGAKDSVTSMQTRVFRSRDLLGR